VLTTYADILRKPGALRFCAAAFVMRLPMSMLGLGAVLFLTLRGESYALAGAVSAAGALSNAVVGPFLSRYIDRYSQHRIVPVAISIAVTFQVLFVVSVLEGWPVWTWFAAFCLGEAFVPTVGSLVRARWAYVLDDAADVRTAFALESVIDEVVFIAGPPIATLLAISVVQWGAVGAAVVLLIVGTLWLVPQRRTEPPPAGDAHREGRGAIRYPGIALVTAVFFFLGGVFGAFEVVTVASAEELGVQGWTGVLLAVYALGSGIAGLTLGALHLKAALPAQLRWFLVLLAVVSVPFPFLHSPVLLGAVAFVAGVAVAPSLITGMALVERLVPSTRLTEGLTISFAGITVGFALAAPTSGLVIDSLGPATAYWILTGSAIACAVVGLAGGRHLERALARADAEAAYSPEAPTALAE
jgi:predicted MFS family arabinose efflux permease